MKLAVFSRRITRTAVSGLVLLLAMGGLYAWRVDSLRQDLVDLIRLQASSQALVDGARAIATFGAETSMMTAFEAEAQAIQEKLRELGHDLPGALAAAETVELLLEDSRRLDLSREADGTALSRDRRDRLGQEIADHGIVMISALTGATLEAHSDLVRADRVMTGFFLGGAALLLCAVLATAVQTRRRVAVPLQGLLEAIREIRAGRLATAPEPGHTDEVGEVITAFNDLVRRGLFLEGEVERQQDTLIMAGRIAGFGGWRYDIATDTLRRSDEVARIVDEGPGRVLNITEALDYFEGSDRGRLEKMVRDCLENGTPFDGIFRIRTSSGRLLWVRSAGQANIAADGTITGANGAFQDVNDLVEARQREERQVQIAAEAQKHESLGKLTGGVAHDFNNLLAVILGNLELLRDDEHDPDRRDMIDAAIAASTRGADLTRNMLAFARRAPLEPQVMDLNEVVGSVRNMASRTLPSTVSIEAALLPGLWKIRADRASTESALLNLIVNANDAMGGKGNLTIETSNLDIEADYVLSRDEDIAPGRYVMLGVSDTGSGIAPSNIGRIFEPFFTTKGRSGGTGLGLSMVQGFLRQTGGTVRVYSEPGTGTTFKLFFPALETGNDMPGDTERPVISAGAAGRRVLLVEDEAAVLEALRKTLERAGYTVIPAFSGDRAFELFSDDPQIDIVVTDIVMPGRLQGPELVRALRGVRPDLPAVFMSGYASEATVHGNGLRPSDIRMMKPVQRGQFLSAVSRALAEAEAVTS